MNALTGEWQARAVERVGCRVGRIRRTAREGQFEFLPRQQPGLDERYPILTQSDFDTGLHRTAAEASQVGHGDASAACNQRQESIEQFDDNSPLALHIRQQESHGTHDKKQSQREGEHWRTP